LYKIVDHAQKRALSNFKNQKAHHWYPNSLKTHHQAEVIFCFFKGVSISLHQHIRCEERKGVVLKYGENVEKKCAPANWFELK
jgi:uncharacterized protein YdeI (YjbR/CyaY-like superfamily)